MFNLSLWDRKNAVCSLICNSMAMREAARRIERAAHVESPVLIWGEDGTGKKLVAETIHRQSHRRDGPLVMLATENCDGRSAEDELFGTAEQPGRLTAASGGTLLIDEITGLPPTGQAKLLDTIEGKHVAELEDVVGQLIDFRLMATTRHEIAESVAQGVLREDLYYRLSCGDHSHSTVAGTARGHPGAGSAHP